MGIFRCLHKFIKSPNSSSSLKSHLSSLLSPPPLASASATAAFSPFCGGGTLLPSPSWRFSQLFRNDVALLPRRLFEGSKSGLGFPKREEVKEIDSAVATSRRESLNNGGGGGGGGGGVVESFVNWPNFISFSRMLSGPFLGWMIVNEWYLPAFVGLAVSGATDWLDGYLARRMGINSVVGSYLDPLADKVLVGCVAVAMVENHLLHPGLVGLVVLRDVMLVAGAVYKRGSSLNWQWNSWYDFFNLDGNRPQTVEPLLISKVNTVLQLILVAGALLQPELGTSKTQVYMTYLSWLVASTTVASTAAYGVQHMRSRSISIARSH